MSFVQFKNVTKTYVSGEVEIHALTDVNFQIEEGEMCIIVGESGAGKTTILNILGGMDQATGGTVILDGKEITGLGNKELTLYRRKDIGFVFQFYNLIPNLTAEENVSLATQLTKDHLPPEDVLKGVGLQDRMRSFPAQLSGGEQQRVAIARALAKKPKLLLCDEPTGALDYNTGKSVLKLLSQYSKDYGITVVIITHNHALTSIGNRVIHVKNGTVISQEVNDNPKDIDEIEW